MRLKSIATLVCLFTLAAASAQAAPLDDYRFVDFGGLWQYYDLNRTIGRPGDPLETATRNLQYEDIDWSVAWAYANAGFGSKHPPTGHIGVSPWPAKHTLLLKKYFAYDDLVNAVGQEAKVTGLTISGIVDNAMALFINGFKVQGYYGNGTAYGDFSFTYHISAEELEGIWVQGGDNIFQIAATDTGGDTYFDLQITVHSVSGRAVPIPAAAWLMGTGLVGIAALRRRAGQKR